MHNVNSLAKCIRDGVWKYTHFMVAVTINTRRDEGSHVAKENLRVMLDVAKGEHINYFEVILELIKVMANPNHQVEGLGCSSLIIN